MSNPVIRSFHPSDRDWLVDQHQSLYARDEGFDNSFGPLVAQILDDFIATHDPEHEAGWIAEVDGNLTRALLDEIATHPAFAAADLRVAPASPGKAERLTPFLTHGRAVLYVNLEEASILCQQAFDGAAAAAAGLVARGAVRALVTDGGRPAADATAAGVIALPCRPVLVTRVTGAGDTFMAAHIAAELAGKDAPTALADALRAAAQYVSGETRI